MSKKYHLDQNEAAFIHCLNSAFAGLYFFLGTTEGEENEISKEDLVKVMKELLSQANTTVVSEFIRGELIKKGVISNEDPIGLCTFDPSVDNKNSITEVFEKDELDGIRLKNLQPDWAKDSPESSPEPR